MRIMPWQYNEAPCGEEPKEQKSYSEFWRRISSPFIIMRLSTEPGYPRADNENRALAI